MEVFLANEQDLPLDEAHLTALARYVLTAEEIDGSAQLSILFVTGGHMRKLNQRFASNDYATDVLAFPMREEDPDGSLVLGDIVICPEVALRNARRLKHSLATEVDTLLVHGALHLLGWDHEEKEDQAKMDRRLKDLLELFERSRA